MLDEDINEGYDIPSVDIPDKNSDKEYRKFIKEGLKKNGTPKGYAHPNDAKKYSEADYEEAAQKRREEDAMYDAQTILTHMRAENYRAQENAERLRNRCNGESSSTDDELREMNKKTLIIAFGCIFGIAVARLFRLDVLGYLICGNIGLGLGFFTEQFHFNNEQVSTAIVKSIALMIILGLFEAFFYLFI